jgi:predicted nucleotidyltransferase component of viral defense system
LWVLSARQIVELFHLRFVHAFYASLPDKRLVAIKGGINLRFFFQSVRFSEDLDLDVATIAKETLENRVDRLLKSPALLSPLKARGLVLKDVSKPKQTETVQKWKIGVSTADASVEERTKIEFSRRDDVSTAELEKVDPEITSPYGAGTVLATHYLAADAVRQKIHALAARTETQPRDVFDLNVLFPRGDAPSALDEEARTWIPAAIDNAGRIEFDDYVALVVSFLEPEHRDLYGSREAWDAMQLDVIERLESLK